MKNPDALSMFGQPSADLIGSPSCLEENDQVLELDLFQQGDEQIEFLNRRTGYRAWLTVSAAEILMSILASAGLSKAQSAKRTTESGIVAENKRVWRERGVFWMILVTPSIKPMSSIRSTSSRMRTSIFFKFKLPWPKWSSKRPALRQRCLACYAIARVVCHT